MLTAETIQKLSGAKLEVAKLWLPLMQEYLPKFEINTNSRLASFLSQVGHESGGLYYTEEIASGSSYEGRKDLGNTQTGDGVKFKGRGLIQTTGRANYTDFKNKYGIDVVSNPSLLGGKNALVSTPEQRKNALLAALHYWNKKKLNLLSDKLNLSNPVTNVSNTDTIKQITKIINGGYNGLQDRLGRFEKGRSYLQEKLIQVGDTLQKNSGKIVMFFFALSIVAGGIVLYNNAKG